MRAISALDVRARFGQVLDEAATGERFVVERAGQPVAAIVPLRDLDAIDPAAIRARRLAAVDQLVRLRARGAQPAPATDAIVAGTSVERARRDGPVGDARRADGIAGHASGEPGRRDRRIDEPDRMDPAATGVRFARSRRRRGPDRDVRTDEIIAEAGLEQDGSDRPTNEPDRTDRGSPADTGWRQW